MPRSDQNSFLTGANSAFIAELYARYLDDPMAVDASWRDFFAELAEIPEAVRKSARGPPWAPPRPAMLNGHGAPNGHAERPCRRTSARRRSIRSGR